METLRTSSYLIPVKLESEPGKYMLIHGYTGAIDIVTESLLKKIQAVASGVDLPEDTLQTLIKRGYITTRSQEEEYAYVARIAKALHKKECLLHTSFTWVVTYNCNFRCPYCFEGREQKNGNHHIVFTQEMVDKAFRAMEQIQSYRERGNNVITLYGGEPLLAENKDIVTYIVEEGVKRGYKFEAITNGYDLDCFLDLLSSEKINKLQITIDGVKEEHNVRRIHYKYHDSFDKIISNLKLALKKDVFISVRINVDRKNFESFMQLKSFFNDIGLTQNPKFKFYSAYLRENDSMTSLEQEKIDVLSRKEYLVKNYQSETLQYCQNYGLYQRINEAILNKRPIPLRSVFCKAQVGGYVLDPLGHIYPCWEVIGNRDYLIASYNKENIQWNESVSSIWRKCRILEDDKCRSCRYALLCGGGCFYHSKGNNKGYCYYFKTMLEYAINKASILLN